MAGAPRISVPTGGRWTRAIGFTGSADRWEAVGALFRGDVYRWRPGTVPRPLRLAPRRACIRRPYRRRAWRFAAGAYLARQEPRIIDCLEFNDNLRANDPFDELAFLMLERERLDGASVARYLRIQRIKLEPISLLSGNYAGGIV